MRWIRTVPRTALCSFSGSWSLAHVASHRLELAAFSPFPLSQCIYTSWHTLLIKPPFPHPLTAYGWNHRPCPVELFTIKLSKTLGLHNLVAMRCNRVRNSPWLCCQLRESFFFYRNVGQLCKNRSYMKTLKKNCVCSQFSHLLITAVLNQVCFCGFSQLTRGRVRLPVKALFHIDLKRWACASEAGWDYITTVQGYRKICLM